MTAEQNEPVILVRDLSHTYTRRDEVLKVLDGVSLRVERGAYVSLVGPSGSGKSTLLSILGGLERPQSGQVVIDGTELGGLSGDQLAAFRRRTVGFVFQHFGLLEALTALENVELALALNEMGARARRGRASDLLDSVGLGARLHHRPYELSGGERQRVAIARAIANEPDLVLADEPTGNLDIGSAAVVADLLASLRDRRGCTLLVVTHNPLMAERADVRLALSHGRLIPWPDSQELDQMMDSVELG